jgi:RNA polymerase sporulation-specific sigma factor
MHFRSQKKLQSEVSLSDSIDTDQDGNSLSFMDVVSVDDTMLDDLSASESQKKLRELVYTCLSPRETEIIEQRYGLNGKAPKTQREIAASCGISRSYVSRIEKKALEKLGQEFEKLEQE